MLFSVGTTPCTTFEGMDDPLYMPRRNILVDDAEAPSDIDNLRPGSEEPFTVDRDIVMFTFWFMPAVPIESIRLTRSTNVESMSVSFIRPDSRSSRPVVVDDVSIVSSTFKR